MAIPLGIENKRQVYLVIGLALFIACVGGWELYNYSSAPSTPAPTAVSRANPPRAGATTGRALSGSTSEGHEAQLLTGGKLDPALHLDQLSPRAKMSSTGQRSKHLFS